MLLPPIVLLVPLLLEMAVLQWVSTYQALILPGAIGGFGIFWCQIIADVPDELIDAGRMDGCNAWDLYLRIVVPIIRPGLAALGILTFIAIYEDFVWPVVITNATDMDTLQVMLSALHCADQQCAAWADWSQRLGHGSLRELPGDVAGAGCVHHPSAPVLEGAHVGQPAMRRGRSARPETAVDAGCRLLATDWAARWLLRVGGARLPEGDGHLLVAERAEHAPEHSPGVGLGPFGEPALGGGIGDLALGDLVDLGLRVCG